MNEDDPRLVYLPLDQLDKATNLCDVRRDMYCLVHPTKGLVLFQIEKRRWGTLIGAKLMGNKDERVTMMIQKDHYPWAEIKLIPLIITPIDPKDY